MNTPNNAKSAATITAIKHAFRDLLTEKPYLQISVTELCKKASINRTTFYAHFSNTREVLTVLCADLYESVVNEILPQDGNILGLTSRETILRVMSILKNSKRLYQAYFPELMNSRIAQELISYVKRKYTFTHKSDPSAWETEYKYEFCIQGAISILAKWVAEDCKEDEQNVAELIEGMLRLCIQSR